MYNTTSHDMTNACIISVTNNNFDGNHIINNMNSLFTMQADQINGNDVVTLFNYQSQAILPKYELEKELLEVEKNNPIVVMKKNKCNLFF